MNKVAVITGANGGIGREITYAMAAAGFRIIMVCRTKEKANPIKEKIVRETGNPDIEIKEMDLTSLESVRACAAGIISGYGSIDFLMNNAGVISAGFEQTKDKLEKTVCTNYVGPYLFTRLLLPHMNPGSRIVNMVSCTCGIGKITLPDFFTYGRKGIFQRILVYSNTKLALLLFTTELAEQVKSRKIYVNAADPGIVSTDMVYMKKWFDPLTRLFFVPFIRKPQKGASNAIDLLLKQELCECTGYICANNKATAIASRYKNHPLRKELWDKTEKIVENFLKI